MPQLADEHQLRGWADFHARLLDHDGDVLALMAVAGLAPLDLLGQSAWDHPM
jgi:hypothetical protein